MSQFQSRTPAVAADGLPLATEEFEPFYHKQAGERSFRGYVVDATADEVARGEVSLNRYVDRPDRLLFRYRAYVSTNFDDGSNLVSTAVKRAEGRATIGDPVPRVTDHDGYEVAFRAPGDREPRVVVMIWTNEHSCIERLHRTISASLDSGLDVGSGFRAAVDRAVVEGVECGGQKTVGSEYRLAK